MPQRHLTVADLIASLTRHDPRTPVRLALSPEWPFEHYVGAVTATPGIQVAPSSVPTGAVWIGDGGQIGYLPPEVWVELHEEPGSGLTGAA
ncbi:hypothetical protein [Kitasatospora arboriphila]|uniref:Uncharacterized protein n=1 Tax=Kitasatospora arboriphila TaxID=258052 RepID=A0ABP4E0P0_9ACTN